jgi:hypothetical protein
MVLWDIGNGWNDLWTQGIVYGVTERIHEVCVMVRLGTGGLELIVGFWMANLGTRCSAHLQHRRRRLNILGRDIMQTRSFIYRHSILGIGGI